jgi:hypothetical protein
MNNLENNDLVPNEDEFEILKLKSIIFDIINEQELLNVKFQELEKIKHETNTKLKKLLEDKIDGNKL